MSVLASVQYSQGFQQAWDSTVRFVPRLAGFIVIVIAGHFIARLLAKAAHRVLLRVGFDKAVDKGGIRNLLANTELEASDLLKRLVYYGLMLFVLELGFGVFGPNPVSDLLTGVIAYVPKIFAAAILVVVTAAVAAVVREMTASSLGGHSYGRTVANTVGIILVGVGVFAALDELQIAQPIVDGLFYAILAAFVGVTIVAVGGGGIKPMQRYWEHSLSAMQGGRPRKDRPVDVRPNATDKEPTPPWESTNPNPRTPQGFDN